MSRHGLSQKEQAVGLRKALRSRKTPRWLKPGIRRYLRKLEGRATCEKKPGVGRAELERNRN
jgi:hypothetical protein